MKKKVSGIQAENINITDHKQALNIEFLSLSELSEVANLMPQNDTTKKNCGIFITAKTGDYTSDS